LADGSALALGDQADKSREANPATSACRLQAAPNEAPLQLTGNREPKLERTVTDDAESAAVGSEILKIWEPPAAPWGSKQ